MLLTVNGLLLIFIAFLCTIFVLLSHSKSRSTDIFQPYIKISTEYRTNKGYGLNSFNAQPDSAALYFDTNSHDTGINVGSDPFVTRNISTIMPLLIYQTSMMGKDTRVVVQRAVKSGYRGIDTALQPKFYNESEVGVALQLLFKEKIVNRKDLFIISKYVPIGGHDPHRVPYNRNLSLSRQVSESFQQTLHNLQTDFVDLYIFHSPLQSFNSTMVVWRALEEIYDSGKARQIGISNVYSLHKLRHFYDRVRVKPTVLQNRFSRDTNYDREVRDFCQTNGIDYMSFWTIYGSQFILRSDLVAHLAKKYNKTARQILVRFIMSLGIHPALGSKTVDFMERELDTLAFTLEPEEVSAMERLMD